MNTRRPNARQRGTLYVVVLSVSLIVAVMGVGALLANRVYHRRVVDAGDASAARALAESAVDLAMYRIASNANWRTTYTNDVWTADESLGPGTIAFKIVDEQDASLDTGGEQPIRIHGRGTIAQSVRIFSVEMIPLNATGPALTRAPASWRREILP